METFTISINGVNRTVKADRATPLLNVLRQDLLLTGTKYGCGEGQCGACTVLVDGQTTRSCTTPVGDVGAGAVQTIEGLSQAQVLHRVQQAFLDNSAFQCGFCTSGMIMASVGLLNKNPNPTVNEIREGLNGNICRCGTYSRIVRAVRQAAKGGNRA
jgi:aerobic-type carbon monoxide dehydrogenase small subunit (CoxS/CutS family)